MKCVSLVIVSLCIALLVSPARSAVSVTAVMAAEVSPSYTSADGQYHITRFNTIQSAINAIAEAGVITVHAGTYTEQLQIPRALSIIGDARASVILDARSIDGDAIHGSVSGITIEGMTIRANSGSSGSAGIRLTGVQSNSPLGTPNGTAAQNITISNLTIQNAREAGIDLNGITNGTITNVTITGSVNGQGIGLNDCRNITMSQITTSDNSYAGIRMTANGTYFPGGLDNITLGAGNAISESYAEVYSEIDNTKYAITNLHFAASGLNYRMIIKGDTRVAYVRDVAAAATRLVGGGMSGAVADVSAENYYITGGLTIADAISVALPGASLTLDPGTYTENVAITKTLSFASGGDVTLSNLTVNAAGGLTLHRPVTVTGTLTMQNGNISSTAASPLTLGTSAAITGETGTKMVLGTLIIRRTVSASNTFGGIGFEATNVGGTLGLVTVTRTTGPVAAGNKGINRTWEVAAANSAAVSFTFKWFPEEDNTTVWSSTVKARVYGSLNGTEWTPKGSDADVHTLSPRSITVPISGAYKYFTVGNSEALLPAELSSFTALTIGNNIRLHWSTATERDKYGFDVERCTSRSTWQTIGFIYGAGTSNAPHEYMYTDTVTAGTYGYRLKQTDRNGTFVYSSTVEASVACSPDEYALSQNFPNPFNPSTTIRFAVKIRQHAVVTLYNALGQEVRTLFTDTAQPETLYALTVDATGLPSGSYYYVLRTEDRTEVKRMVFVK